MKKLNKSDRDKALSSFKIFRNYIFRNVYRGDARYCIYCGKSANRFLSIGSKAPRLKEIGAVGISRRPNGGCPYCGSSDRSRLLRLYLEKQLSGISEKKEFLHISPDDILARWLSQRSEINYSCGSLYPEDFSEFDAFRLDVSKIDLPDNKFDIILCNHVLQQVPEHIKALNELSRILKPGGWAIIQAPVARKLDAMDEDLTINDPREKRQRFGSTLHCRIYGRDYAALLQANGNWQVTEIKPDDFLKKEDVFRNSLIENEIIYRVDAL